MEVRGRDIRTSERPYPRTLVKFGESRMKSRSSHPSGFDARFLAYIDYDTQRCGKIPAGWGWKGLAYFMPNDSFSFSTGGQTVPRTWNMLW